MVIVRLSPNLDLQLGDEFVLVAYDTLSALGEPFEGVLEQNGRLYRVCNPAVVRITCFDDDVSR